MPEKDDLDSLLDSALASYADPGPDSGLEQRVLFALAAERDSSELRIAAPWRRRWLAWAIAVPFAASMVLWIGLEFRHALLIQQQQASQSGPSLSSHGFQVASDIASPAPGALKGHDFSRAANATKSRRALAPEGRPSKTTLVENREPLPKLAVFPSPQPLTREERVLVASANLSSDAQRQALLTAAKPPPDGPLSIADLSIPPIVPPGEGNN